MLPPIRHHCQLPGCSRHPPRLLVDFGCRVYIVLCTCLAESQAAAPAAAPRPWPATARRRGVGPLPWSGCLLAGWRRARPWLPHDGGPPPPARRRAAAGAGLHWTAAACPCRHHRLFALHGLHGMAAGRRSAGCRLPAARHSAAASCPRCRSWAQPNLWRHWRTPSQSPDSNKTRHIVRPEVRKH